MDTSNYSNYVGIWLNSFYKSVVEKEGTVMIPSTDEDKDLMLHLVREFKVCFELV